MAKNKLKNLINKLKFTTKEDLLLKADPIILDIEKPVVPEWTQYDSFNDLIKSNWGKAWKHELYTDMEYNNTFMITKKGNTRMAFTIHSDQSEDTGVLKGMGQNEFIKFDNKLIYSNLGHDQGFIEERIRRPLFSLFATNNITYDSFMTSFDNVNFPTNQNETIKSIKNFLDLYLPKKSLEQYVSGQLFSQESDKMKNYKIELAKKREEYKEGFNYQVNKKDIDNLIKNDGLKEDQGKAIEKFDKRKFKDIMNSDLSKEEIDGLLVFYNNHYGLYERGTFLVNSVLESKKIIKFGSNLTGYFRNDLALQLGENLEKPYFPNEVKGIIEKAYDIL